MTKIYKTPEYKKLVNEIYKESVKGWGHKVAKETANQIEKAENSLKMRPKFGKLDPKYHSDRFKFVEIKNSYKLFFEKIGDDIVMVHAGHHSMKWNKILPELAIEIDKQLQKLKQHSIQE